MTLRIIQTAYYVTACLALSQASGCTKQVSETRPAAAVSSAIPIEPNGTVAPPLTMRSGSSLAATKSTALRLLEWKKRASAGASDDGASTEPAGVMRPGLWDRVTNRFSPTEKSFVRALAMYALEGEPRWMVVRGERELGLTSLLVDVTVNLMHTTYPEKVLGLPHGYEAPDRLELAAQAGVPQFRVHLPPGSVGSRSEWSPFQALIGSASGPLPHPRLAVMAEGCVFVGVPSRWRLNGVNLVADDGNMYVLPRNVAKAEHTLVLNTSGGVWVSATQASCTWEGAEPQPKLNHTVLRLSDGGASVIHQGSGSANLRAVNDDEVLVQVDNRTRLLRADASAWQQGLRLPSNVVLAPPLEPKVCYDL